MKSLKTFPIFLVSSLSIEIALSVSNLLVNLHTLAFLVNGTLGFLLVYSSCNVETRISENIFPKMIFFGIMISISAWLSFLPGYINTIIFFLIIAVLVLAFIESVRQLKSVSRAGASSEKNLFNRSIEYSPFIMLFLIISTQSTFSVVQSHSILVTIGVFAGGVSSFICIYIIKQLIMIDQRNRIHV